MFSQSASAVRCDPEIVVITGQSKEPGGQKLLQKNFLMTYTVSNDTLLHMESDTIGRIRMEEPFNSHLVSERVLFLTKSLMCVPFVATVLRLFSIKCRAIALHYVVYLGSKLGSTLYLGWA